MIDALKDFYEAISIIDLIFLIITIFSIIKCYSKGFVLSLLSASKWLVGLCYNFNSISKKLSLILKT